MNFLTTSPFGIWTVAIVIIIIDSVIFLKEGLITAAFYNRKFKLRIIEYPYLLRGREPIITLLTFPFRIFLVLLPTNEKQTPTHIYKFLEKGYLLTRECRYLRLLASLSFGMVVLVGPFISVSVSISFAVISVWSSMYIIGGICLIMVYAKKFQLRINNSVFLILCFEIAVCPFLVANVVKKVVIAQEVDSININVLSTIEKDRLINM